MRIIGGSMRGRRLTAPTGRGTRPILDRQKEALFNIIQGRFPMGCVVDLFAGSGGLGLEALSRGAESAVFVERDRRALSVLKSNIAALGVGERCRLVPRDVLKGGFGVGGEVGLVFLDPPFPLVAQEPQRVVDLMQLLAAELSFAEAALLCLRTPTSENDLAVPGPWESVDRRVMGESVIHLYSPR